MPGERLIEADLARELNVSRTPLREAFRMLAAEKKIELLPNKGASVMKHSPSEVEEIYFIASILEGAAADHAVKRMGSEDIKRLKGYQSQMEDAVLEHDYEKWLRLNNKFHGVFVHKANMPALLELIKEKVDSIPYYWFLLTMRPDPLKVYMDAHEKIIDAFIKKDANLVRSLVEKHISTNGEVLREHLQMIAIH